MIEREIKVRVSSEVFQSQLQKLQGVRAVKQEDLYLDLPECPNLNAKRDLRVRVEDGHLKSIQFKTIFFLAARQKWFVEEEDFTQATADQIMRRLGIAFDGQPLPALAELENVLAYFAKFKLSPQLQVTKCRWVQAHSWGEICLDTVEGLGHFIELEMLEADPEGKLAELGIQYEEVVRLGYTELICERDPARYLSSSLKQRMFKQKADWNVSKVDVALYIRLSSRRVIWTNLSCIVYDISVPYYLEQLARRESSIELCYVNYWDNLLNADAIVDRALPGLAVDTLLNDNVRRIRLKLDQLLPQRCHVVIHSDLERKALAFLRRPLNHVAGALDTKRMQEILSKSRMSLQVLNNMVVDFLLCCFATRLGLEKVDVYYVGTRFKPLEPIFRKYGSMGEGGFNFPKLEYIELPRFPKDADGNRVNPYMTKKEVNALAHSPDIDTHIVEWLSVPPAQLGPALWKKMTEVSPDA